MQEVSKYGQLNNEQRAYIFRNLALKKEFGEVKQLFERLFECKISGEVIIQLARRFQNEIKEVAEIELNNIEQSPIAHARIRLEIIYTAMQYALQPRVVDSKRVGANDWEKIYDIDHAAVAKYLNLAQQEEYMSKRLYYDILKNKDIIGSEKPKSGFTPIKINSGLSWQTEENMVE